MGRIISHIQQSSLRKSFAISVLITALVATILSFGTIFTCTYVQHQLVPIRDEVMLHVYRQTSNGETYSSTRMRANGDIQDAPYIIIDGGGEPIFESPVTRYSIEPLASPSYLSPKRWLLYNAMDVCKIALPVLYSVAGIIISSALFYNRKLARPIALLEKSSQQIAENNLDFIIKYDAKNEMGRLCEAFEKMRAALLESQRDMWKVMEERKQLNASVAHDLRTPITIIQGYSQYLQRNMKSGKVNEEKLLQIIGNLSESATRMEYYVDCISDIQSLEDLVLEKKEHNITDIVSESMEDFTLLAQKTGKYLLMSSDIPEDITVFLDKQAFFRIMENIVSNALRYSKQDIQIKFTLKNDSLLVSVLDDGLGFTREALLSACTPFYKESGSKGHMGLGLSVCSILCKKHGGFLTVSNHKEGGGMVSFELLIN